jgi:hypothetical protein
VNDDEHVTPPYDRFDDVRREWIARHAGIFTIQKRRAEVLNRQIRDRTRRVAGARPNPHDDNVIHPLLSRRATTAGALLELTLVLAAAVLAPIGWFLGHLLYCGICRYIPDRLRSYPIPALLWTSVGIGVLTALLYQPGDGLGTALAAPWLIAQVPAAFLTAGMYGILNGWLAVDGSADWWPLTPPPAPVDLDIPLGPDDLTGPGVFARHEVATGEEPTPVRRGYRVSVLPLATALIVTGMGVTWTVAMVLAGVKSVITIGIG